MSGPQDEQARSELFTVVGARGFIGSSLVAHLRRLGHEVREQDRYAPDGDENLGHVIFAAGVTADFRWRPIDTMEAHVSALSQMLATATFESFLYFSSTRVYEGADEGHEDGTLAINPNDPLQLYNASKVAGEALCLALPREDVRVLRLSNVFGARDRSDALMSALMGEADSGAIQLRTSRKSAKDFVLIDDVVNLIPKLIHGRHRLYNLAFGQNQPIGEIVDILAELSGASAAFTPDAEIVMFPPINVARIQDEFGFQPTPIKDALSRVWREYQGMTDD
ncbi:MAG: NAD(P)-dependent oxidoreductase [Pseudomonadota bacterium]